MFLVNRDTWPPQIKRIIIIIIYVLYDLSDQDSTFLSSFSVYHV